MQSSKQRRRLLQVMNAEPVRMWMALAKCGAGLTVIVLLSVIGASGSFNQDAAGVAAAPGMPQAENSAREHRKQVFDERRARFEKRAKRNSGAIEVVDLPKDLPVELL